jgi:hypothetical protein
MKDISKDQATAIGKKVKKVQNINRVHWIWVVYIFNADIRPAGMTSKKGRRRVSEWVSLELISCWKTFPARGEMLYSYHIHFRGYIHFSGSNQCSDLSTLWMIYDKNIQVSSVGKYRTGCILSIFVTK